ncbi:MAG: two-component system response regulator GlrR, partial [Gammaproteobacteria bacterium]
MPKKADAKYRILVVDDDDDILALLRTWLGNEGFEVLTCSSGEDALGQLHTTNPNLVITDLFMGGMSGMELLSIIHRDNPLLPVIMLSGQAKIPDAVKATHLGSSAFLTKPINKEELFDQVKRALRLSSDTRAEQVRP